MSRKSQEFFYFFSFDDLPKWRGSSDAPVGKMTLQNMTKTQFNWYWLVLKCFFIIFVAHMEIFISTHL